MFGWEFPPHIAGGLGTACYGLTRGLAKHDVGVIFVVPKAYGDEDGRFVRVVNASDVEVSADDTREKEIWEKLTFIHVDSNMVPYVSPEEFDDYSRQFRETGELPGRHDVWKERYAFSGKYGPNLMEEVARYAMVAAQIARDRAGEFDVIHAHDWLTYYAGIAAKRVSGKPLVVHMHATEFDRSGEHVNQSVYNIERAGMEAADRVIAVSNLTRNIVIEKYGIPADKVVTVHNAVRFDKRDSGESERNVEDKIVTFLGRITYQKGPDYFVEAAAKVLKRLPNVRFVMAQRRYVGPCDPARRQAGDCRPVPFYRVSARGRSAKDVRYERCVCDAVGVGTVRNFAAGSDEVERPGDHFETVGSGRSARLRDQGRLLGCGRDGGRDLRPVEISVAGGDVGRKGEKRSD